MSLLTGQTFLDRYFLRQHIGSGGMADVYQAWDSVRSTTLAIKVLRRDLALNPRFFQMFAKEAELLRKLEHPNIVRLYEFDRQDDMVFMVMDWVDGISLNQDISGRGQPATTGEVSNILLPVCSALHYAHQNQVYHCDVKPANILLHTSGQVQLTDFGVARLAEETTGGGTPSYMAPEQFTGGRVDARTDVYALGVVMYEMLSGGYVPYRGETSSSKGNTARERIAWEHLNLPLPDLRQFTQNIPDAVQKAIKTALSKNPSQRYATTAELRNAFEHACKIGPHREEQQPTAVSTNAFPSPLEISEKPSQLQPPPQSLPLLTAPPQVRGKPHLYFRTGQWKGHFIPLTLQGLTLGRSKHNQLQIREASVSRQHATVLVTKVGCVIRDENSSLGTFVNGQRISGPTSLRHGDVIRIGYHQVFEFREK